MAKNKRFCNCDINQIITCEHDLHIVADALKAKIGVYNAEFVMAAVLNGKINFDLTQSLTTI